MARWFLFSLMLLGLGCQNSNDQSATPLGDRSTPTSGEIRISVDESFKPVIDSQIKVFQASFPNTKIIAEYKPEAACLKDLENDSIRLVIVTRGLSAGETEAFKQKLGFAPSWGLLAYDAVAVVTNKKAQNKYFTMSQLKNMLAGNSPSPLKIVMDGLSATSTVRFAKDSLINGAAFGSRVVAKQNSPDVIDYVASDPNAIGMIGVSWVGNQKDDQQLSFSDDVDVAALKCETCKEETWVKPYQANIATGRYPLIRTLHFILKENYNGLGRGFVNFLTYERGQLIFKRAYLLPARMQFSVRDMKISE